ncbi:Ribosomal_protein S3a [Hexamita inflata]|uniref:Small ribosomal subunit protein eS1 n=1 Tax=Hexamita inflata TaxID=28002 RepID=A0AA86UVD0_9EUKA|nr:Ribosomal protein S3a [Hexamita inflata]CAI9966176.1 Ribosomal protein S3a [Hexamita inflata]
MAIGNNSNKKKKIIVRTKPDPYLRKEWYNVRAPTMFKHNDICQTPVLKTAGLRVSSECIKGRVYTANLGDLAENEAVNGNINFQFKAMETKENNSLTDFFGYTVTRHKYQSLFRKGCSRISCVSDVTTKDGYQLRVFGIAFTERTEKQHKINCYAKTSQIKNVRKIMNTKVQEEIKNSSMAQVMAKLAGQSIDEKMNSNASKVVLLRDVLIQRVKLVQAPRFDSEKFASLYSGVASEFGKKVEKKE